LTDFDTPQTGDTRMRAVVQRVRRAQVDVEGETIGAIGSGLLILLGVAPGDTVEQCVWMADGGKAADFPG